MSDQEKGLGKSFGEIVPASSSAVDRVLNEVLKPDGITARPENVGGIVLVIDHRSHERQVEHPPTLELLAGVVPGGMERLTEGLVLQMDPAMKYGQVVYVHPDLKAGDFVEINKLQLG